MDGCKVSLLETSLSPERVRIVLELVPPEGSLFDMKLEDPGKKISQIANYALVTFDVNPNPPVPSLPDPVADEERAKHMDERRKQRQQRTDEANRRVLDTFERELAEAKKSGDPRHIEQAKAKLEQVKARIEGQKENRPA